jgi:hypothetical protein
MRRTIKSGEMEEEEPPVDLTKVALVQIYSVLTTIRQSAGKDVSQAIAEDMDRLGETLASLLESDTAEPKKTNSERRN